MSKPPKKPLPDSAEHTEQVRAAQGLLAVGLAGRIARPLDEIRELLATVVAVLDHHVANAKGPDPLGYDESKEIRESIADAYLKGAQAARIAGDLAVAVAPPPHVAETVDLNRLLDDAIGLVRHQFSTSTEIFIDHGTIPSVSVPRTQFVLAITRLLLSSADSTRDAAEAAISVRTRISRGQRSDIVLTVADNGRGLEPDDVRRVTGLAEQFAREIGGSFDVASEPGGGATFELRVPS